MKLMHKLLASRKGYTIDQTILIIAIIAILITLIILTIAWALINRSSGTRAGSQLNQIEDAIGQFYSVQKIWPTDGYSTGTTVVNSTQAAAVLAGAFAPLGGADTTDQRNYIKGFKLSATGTTGKVLNGYGGTVLLEKAIGLAANGVGTSKKFLVVTFPSVPVSDFNEADKAIDGAMDGAAGRLYAVADSGNCVTSSVASTGITVGTTGTVKACFLANAAE